METTIDEVSDRIYRISTYVADADLTFNQVLVDADEPMLFHLGMRALFPLAAAPDATVAFGGLGCMVSVNDLDPALRRPGHPDR